MSELPDLSAQKPYALDQLAQLQGKIIQLSKSMVLQRARIERCRQSDLAAARDIYAELSRTRETLVETLAQVQLFLMEMEEYALAKVSGQLRQGLAGFALMSTGYKSVYEALSRFASSLPVGQKTNAAVVGRLMNNIKLGYYPTDPDNTVWVEIEKRGRSFVIKDSERARLDNAYLSALKRLGLTPAAACGIQSLLTPKTLPGQTAPEENAPAASPQPKQGNSQPAPASALQRADQPATRSDSQQTQPVQQSRAAASRTVPFALPQSAARQRTDCYVVLSTKVQGGMSGSSTLVTLRAPDGKQIPAFARGARPELSTGTVLSNVKLTMRQQDTVAFYVLESYEIVPQEDRAA